MSSVAVIVEPRAHPALHFVIQNVHERLGWPIVLFHGLDNVAEATAVVAAVPTCSLQALPVHNLTPKGYNDLFKTESFWKRIPGEHVLIFQTDSVLLANTPERIQSFLHYDYVGAPWPRRRGGRRKVVGNGGLSLRRRSSSLVAAAAHTRRPSSKSEDRFFPDFFSAHPSYRVAPWQVAMRFSVQIMYVERPFGVHQCWRGLTAPQFAQIQQVHPEVKVLFDLQLSPKPQKPQKRRTMHRPRIIHRRLKRRKQK